MIKFYMYFKRGLLLVMALALFNDIYAQERVVSGKVTEDGTAIPGVNVLIKGTTRGTVSDVEGNYRLSVDDGATLVFSAIGYTTEEVAVGNRSTIDLNMTQDIRSLQEVVVTGYTTEDRRQVTGAVSTVKARDLVAVPTGNIEQGLQGRVSGVTVITNGQPGTTSVVRVRGFGSFTNNEPLYIVDGVPVDGTGFLAPDDIETTTVLKDAASASIYGARAASGVIVYTTKKGKKGADGRLRVSYDGVTGVTVPGKVENILNPQQQANVTWLAKENTAWQLGEAPDYSHDQYSMGPDGNPILPDYIMVGPNVSGYIGTLNMEEQRALYNIDASAGGIYQVMKANKEGTDWWDAITRVAPMNRHTLGFSGGNENSNYYVSLSAQDQKGILLNQSFKRYTLRVNSEHNVLKNLRIGQNFQGTYSQIRGLTGGNGGRGAAGDENSILGAFRMPTIIPVYDEFGGYGGTAAKGFNNPRNPVAERDRIADNSGYQILGFGNLYAELDLFKGFTFRSSIGGAVSNTYFWSYGRPSYENSENNNTFSYSEGANSFMNWTFTNTAKYSNTFGLSSIDLLVGHEALNSGFGRSINGTGQNPFSRDLNYINLNNVPTARNVGSNYDPGITFESLFGRAQYSYNEKYIITGVLRRDGSSVFGPNYRHGVFPAFSAAWRISDEGFMTSVPAVNDLKIRGGWGQMGNSRSVNRLNQFSLYSPSLGLSSYPVAGGNTVSEGYYRSRIGNADARWETAITTNIGFDGAFFNNKWELVVDIWRKDTEDLLYSVPLAGVVGNLAAAPTINIANMRNQGLDIEVTNRGNIAGGLRYEVRATGSFLNNTIQQIAPGLDNFSAGGTRIGAPILNEVDRPMSSFFGYKVEGLFQNQAEVDAAAEQDGAAPGRFRFADTDGNGVINSSDRQHLGSPIPKFNGGLNVRLNYRNFELETFIFTFLGFENMNMSRWFTDFYPSFTGAAYGTRVLESWTPERGGNTVPIFEDVANFSTNGQINSYYVENGNYLRMGNLQIAYNFPESTLSRVGLEKARLYIQGTNLFTVTNYSGLDPGVGGAADTSLGIDVGNPPVTQGFNIGVNLGF